MEKLLETVSSSEEAWKRAVEIFGSEVKGAFERVEKVLCVQPHPDDVDVAAGGTIAKLTRKGVEVIYVTMTDGRLGSHDPSMDPEELARIRRSEQEEAAKLLGVKKVVWLGYKDGELKPTLDARRELVKLVREFKPDMVLAPDPWLTYEAHPDHRAAGIIAAEAVLYSSIPLAPPRNLRPHAVRYIAFYWTRKPNTFIDVTDYLDLKLKAIRAHKSQFSAAPFIEEVLKFFMRLAAIRAGISGEAAYAEPFKVLTPFHLHCNVFAEDV